MFSSTAYVFSIWVLIITFTTVSSKSLYTRSEDDVCDTDACKKTAALLLASMNQNVNPCDDFYEYACGGWIAKNPVPPSDVSYSNFQIVEKKLYERLEDVFKNPPDSVKNLKSVLNVQNFYQGCMDEDSRDVQPLKEFINKELGGFPISNPDSWDGSSYKWLDVVAHSIRTLGRDTLIGIGVSADDKNKEKRIIVLGPVSVIMKRKKENSTVDEDSSKVGAYIRFIIRTAKHLGADVDNPKFNESLKALINFELDLSETLTPSEEFDDPESLYNKMTVSELQQKTEDASFNWKNFLNMIFKELPQVDDSTEINVLDMDFLNKMLKLVAKTDVATLANYITWKSLYDIGYYATKELRLANFEFEQALYGLEEPIPLNRICIREIINSLEFAASRMYVERYYDQKSKEDITTLVKLILGIYRKSMEENGWMDESTTKAAVEKLDAMISFIAYPDWIQDNAKLEEHYQNLELFNPKEYFKSRVNVDTYKVVSVLKDWQKKTDPNEWVGTPMVVNAYYYFNDNSITLPLGILQNPFYDSNRVPQLNYGGIGFVIGHEITHGFDSDGSYYNKDGNMLNWWSNETRAEFKKKSECFRKQYNQIVEPISGKHVNGNASLGENIADNGSIRNVFKAYKDLIELLKEKGKSLQLKLSGIDATPDQLFFLGYASTWCSSFRDEALKSLVEKTHALAKYRVNVPLSNFEEFSKTFNCPEDSKMNPKEKCVLW